MAFGLFINRNDIIKTTPLQGAIDADKLLPFIKTAQQKYIENLLGTVLYNKLQDDVESQTPFTGYYLTLMEEYVKPTLIWYACVEYIPFSGTSFKSEGAVRHKSDQSEAAPKTELDYLAQKAQDNAEWYATRMQDYCIAYSNELPEYLQTTGNNTMIYPDQSNQYFSGLQL